MTEVMNSMIAPQSKTMSRVLPSCFVSPLTRVRSESAAGSRSVSMQGPRGQKRVEALAARELHVLLLQIARGDVVGAGEAEDDAAPVVAADVARGLADDDGQLPFEIDALRLRRADDRAVRSEHGGRRFQKNDRLGRRFVAELLRVLGVVAADGDDLRRRHRREKLGIGERDRVVRRPRRASSHRCRCSGRCGRRRRLRLDGLPAWRKR